MEIGQNDFVHDKTKFAEHPQEWYLWLGQTWIYPRNTKTWSENMDNEDF